MKQIQAIALGLALIVGLGYWTYNKNNELQTQRVSSHSNMVERKPNNETVNNMNSLLLNAKTAAELNLNLEQILTQPQFSSSLEAKLYRALLVPTRALRSIIWRSIPVAEKFPAFHSLALYSLRRFYYNLPAHAPHMKTWIDFFSEPPASELTQFQSLKDIQDEFTQKLTISFAESQKLLTEVIQAYEKSTNTNPVVLSLDLKLIYGDKVENLILEESESNRYFQLKLADLYAFKAYLQQVTATGLYLASFNFDRLDTLLATQGQNYRKKAFVRKIIPSSTFPSLATLHEELSKPEFSNLFQLRDEAQLQLVESHPLLKLGERLPRHTLQLAQIFFIKAYNNKAETLKIMQTHPEHRARYDALESFFAGRYSQLSRDRVALMLKLLKNENQVVQDLLFTDTVKVSMPHLFDPKKMADIKKFMAESTAFTRSPAKIDRHGKTRRNYLLGNKTALKDPTLGGVFPEVKNIEELRSARESMQRSQVGFPFITWMEIFL